MNNWHIAGQSIGLYIEFKKDGEFMPPDIGSVKLTVRDNSGVPFSNYNQALQPDVSLTSELVTIPSLVNTVNEGVENRFVRVDYTVGGVPCSWNTSYKLSPFIPLVVLPEDVRNALGVRENELPDAVIDLYDGYYKLVGQYPDVASALVATNSVIASQANRAVLLTVSLTLLPSLPQRVMKQDQLHNASQIRQTIDWDALKTSILGELSECIEGFTLVTASYNTPAIFITSVQPDPVTTCRSYPRRYLEFIEGLTAQNFWGI